MPKASLGDIRLYYRVFRDGKEYISADEAALAAEYFAANTGEAKEASRVQTDKPLKLIDAFEREIQAGLCIDASLPTIIFLPGGPGFIDHSLYLDFWSKLSDVVQIIFLDQRGNGRSDRGDPALWNLDICADDVVKFSEVVGLHKPIVAGVSWGGYVAMQYAIKYPDHPGGLILMHTEASVSVEARLAAFARKAKHLGCEDEITAIQAAVRAYDENPLGEGVKETYLTTCWGELYSKRPYGPKDFAAVVANQPMRDKFATEENLVFDLRSGLGCVKCPVWYGAADMDPAHPVECAREAAALIPDCELTVFEGLGAPAYNDDPEYVLEVVLSQVERLIATKKKVLSI